jgi:ribosome maturation protein Sdo1
MRIDWCPLACLCRAAFGTDNQTTIITRILTDGELQLSAAERKDKVDKRYREIVTYIHKSYADPKSKLPHPVTRIENALEEMKVAMHASHLQHNADHRNSLLLTTAVACALVSCGSRCTN